MTSIIPYFAAFITILFSVGMALAIKAGNNNK
jgi:hypothetical protein